MPLLDFWKASPASVAQLSIDQIVASAGDGMLRDGSICSAELRGYLSQVASEKIAGYIEHCLSISFNKSGMVLQDLVNELGRRLDYKVTNGRYQGSTTTIGFDGIWSSPEGRSIVIEVKTTDAYRISLDTIAEYRSKLTNSGQMSDPSSILIVVGRNDTGELEAQVRGSRHAWDIRLISADALLKLVQIKENAEGQETGAKIRSLLTPIEYTRLDQMIDVMFTAAKNVEVAAAAAEIEEDSDQDELEKEEKGEKGVWQFTEPQLLQSKREEILAAVSEQMSARLIKKSRALFWNASHTDRVVCTLSKRYVRKSSYAYWYAYHPQWLEFLEGGLKGFLALGCMDLGFAFVVPASVVKPTLEALNTTTTKDGHTYWHMHIVEKSPGSYYLLMPKKSTALALEAFQVQV